jgi:hypothetical protein
VINASKGFSRIVGMRRQTPTRGRSVCNLYSITKGQQAIRELSRAMSDRTGNMPPLPGIYPDYRAPIVRNQPDGRELTMARWGTPSPLYALKGKKSDSGQAVMRTTFSSSAPISFVPEPMEAGPQTIDQTWICLTPCHSGLSPNHGPARTFSRLLPEKG